MLSSSKHAFAPRTVRLSTDTIAPTDRMLRRAQHDGTRVWRSEALSRDPENHGRKVQTPLRHGRAAREHTRAQPATRLDPHVGQPVLA